MGMSDFEDSLLDMEMESRLMHEDPHGWEFDDASEWDPEPDGPEPYEPSPYDGTYSEE